MGSNRSTMKINPGEAKAVEISVLAPSAAEHEHLNLKMVKKVYKALGSGDTMQVGKLVGTELEWWYHGPPHSHHMMKVLTGGESTQKGFKFRPRRIRAVGGDRVVVEGWEGVGEYWVHVWKVKDGVIAQLREYFNTLLTVVLRVSEDGDEARLWRSTPWARVQVSLPDLVLAI